MALDATAVQPTTTAQAPPAVVPTTSASDFKQYFTITATLREEYDDNIYTSNTDKVASFKTDFSPSFLVDIPMENSDFSARYTLGLTYFYNRPGDSLDVTNEVVLRYNHSFSDRFNLDMRDRFGYYTEPDVISGTGSLYRDGGYIYNAATVEFVGQWTPLFSTVTSWSNTVYDYQNSSVATEQNSMENIGNQDFSFAILPKINFVVGGILDNISYDGVQRGYTNYTGTTGIDWQALPSLSLGGRVGGSVTDTQGGGGTSSSIYGSFTLNWRLGARSAFNFNYVHDVVPTDVVYAEGQEADRFSATFSYDITSRLTAHLEGIYTHSDYTNALLVTGGLPEFTEDDAGLDTGLDYHFNDNFGMEAGYIFSDVSSQLSFRDYTRNQFYIGVRGTY